MPDRFDGRIVGKSYENNCALTVGVTYHFKKRSFKPVTIKAPEKDLRETLREIIHEELQTQAPIIYNRNGIRDTVVVTQKVSAEPVKSKGEPFTLASFLFNSGKAEPINGQEIQFVNIAEYLKKYPKAKIRLEGYADKQTGNADANLHLSMRRAMKIRSLLIDNYGIDTKRIETQGIGINYQPYKENDWNRVVIVTVVDE
jgi:outer membrane protein OmpA-like peptidoglycan-associated protein